MKNFYVYGFKKRNDYNLKSARSYDNERRRIESWLGDYMHFSQSSSGKSVFLSVDSRSVLHNPFYKAFKAKSFTEKDIMFHFYVLDILSDGKKYSLEQIIDIICDEYLSCFENANLFDESTIRKKLKEYNKLGIIKSEKQGKKLFYYIQKDEINLDSFKDAVAFFSEENPLGVVGSFLLDKYEEIPDFYTFKHHYILHALESEILYSLLLAIFDKDYVNIEVVSLRKNEIKSHKVIPFEIYISTQNGRRYLMCWHCDFERFIFYRLDNINKVTVLNSAEDYDNYKLELKNFKKYLWGVSTNAGDQLDEIRMIVHISDDEHYIVDRLFREKRCGSVEKINKNTYMYYAKVYDAVELLPWIRTFIGRITKLESNNQYMIKTFNDDLEEMKNMYGV